MAMEPAPLFLDGSRLAALLSPVEALGAVQRFFATHTRSQVETPRRIHLQVPGVNTVGLYMPAATGEFVGVKIVHLMPERRPAVEAEIFLYDAPTGRLLFWGDGKPLTALRTAAVSLAATLRLLPRCRSLLVFGAGVQAAAHIEAFQNAYPELERIRVVSRTPAGYERLLGKVGAPARAKMALGHGTEEDFSGVDCLTTTTPAPDPLFDWGHVPQDCHIVAVGGATPAMKEIPPQAFLHSRVWVDTPAALEEAGDCLAAASMGFGVEQVEGDLFDLLGGGEPSLPGGRTLFKSVGHAAQDLALLTHLWGLLRA